jgi:hypothetical protein
MRSPANVFEQRCGARTIRALLRLHYICTTRESGFRGTGSVEHGCGAPEIVGVEVAVNPQEHGRVVS